MKTACIYLYDCVFTSDRKPSRHIQVSASSYGRAASISNCWASEWEDYEAFELTSIKLVGLVVVESSK